MIVHVKAPSRLHFGLLQIPGKETRQNTRAFGGVGLMIEKPGIELSVQPAARWSVDGSEAERALEVGRKVAATQPALIRIHQCPPQHQGLGTGTQLSLAVARGLSELLGRPDTRAVELAKLTGRGTRSAIGIHGFDRGGFLVDAGKSAETVIAPLVAQLAFPKTWRIVLVLSPRAPGMHGPAERTIFEELRTVTASTSLTDRLCQLVLLGLLPALVEEDYPAFCDALTEFNASAGEPFASYQSNEHLGAVSKTLRSCGIRGTGQSSWGPAVFGVAGDEEQARRAAAAAKQSLSAGSEVIVTKADNEGARVQLSQDSV